MTGTKKISEGCYEKRMPVTLWRDGQSQERTATAEIMRRDDLQGWTYTLSVEEEGFTTYLAEHDDVYLTKKAIVEFLDSESSRSWEYVTTCGLNCWCLSRRSAQ